MKFHLIQPGMIGRRADIAKGMAGQDKELYQRYLEEIRGYIRLADGLGFASYGHNEHHLQIEGFEITNHPGMFSFTPDRYVEYFRDLGRLPVDDTGQLNPADISRAMARYATEMIR
jgi:hypothetical protein